jgi:hypothetical protein
VRRTGIDLSSTWCRVVAADRSTRRRTGDAAALRVHDFAALPGARSNEELTAELKLLVERQGFPRRAWVNLWNVRSSHEYVLLAAGATSELETAARHRGAVGLGMSDVDITAAAAIGATRETPGRHARTEVSFFAAGSQDVCRRIQPIVDAGFVVEGVTTPCGALWSQARLRPPAMPGQVHAYVALEACQSAVGIYGNGFLLFARDLDWGYGGTAERSSVPLEREELSTRLALVLRHAFLYLKQYWEEDVSQIVLCGNLPEIRSLTGPLIERLNIDVDILDTLEGIDRVILADAFADQAATFRLALSIAANPPPVNLMPVQRAVDRIIASRRWILAAGTAAAAGFGAFLYSEAGIDRAAIAGEPAIVQREAPDRQPSAEVTPQPQARRDNVVPIHPARATSGRLRLDGQSGPALKPALLDPIVSGILFSSRRQAAVVDGRVVVAGDRVGTAVVQSIEADAVVIVTSRGEMRRLEVARPALGAERP